MSNKTLAEQVIELCRIPRTWPHRRWEAAEQLLAEMAARIEALEQAAKRTP
jgi:hypothetical protein